MYMYLHTVKLIQARVGIPLEHGQQLLLGKMAEGCKLTLEEGSTKDT
jgi:hypothetical protein